MADSDLISPQMSLNMSLMNVDELRSQFLNNHIQTIEEDIEGENRSSEFSNRSSAKIKHKQNSLAI